MNRSHESLWNTEVYVSGACTHPASSRKGGKWARLHLEVTNWPALMDMLLLQEIQSQPNLCSCLLTSADKWKNTIQFPNFYFWNKGHTLFVLAGNPLQTQQEVQCWNPTQLLICFTMHWKLSAQHLQPTVKYTVNKITARGTFLHCSFVRELLPTQLYNYIWTVLIKCCHVPVALCVCTTSWTLKATAYNKWSMNGAVSNLVQREVSLPIAAE